MSPETFLQLDGIKKDWLQGLKLSLERWEKFSMLSGDRSAIVVAQDYHCVAGAIFKLGGGSQVLAGQLSIGTTIMIVIVKANNADAVCETIHGT